MKLAYAPRASAILYHALASAPAARKPILLPANICPIVPLTFLKAGAEFRFIDISPITLHMDLDQAHDLLKTGDYGGLLYAHTYGETSTPSGFFAEMKSINPTLLLIDDRCLCPPDALAQEESQVDVTLYSTGYAKVVDLGYGGYAFLADSLPYQPRALPYAPQALQELETSYKAALAERPPSPYAYADTPWLQTESPLPAWADYYADLSARHAETMQRRMSLNALYAAALPASIQFPPPYQLWRFNIRVEDPARARQALLRAGLFSSSHYASLAGIFAPGSAPHAQALAANVLNLFNDHHFTPQMAQQACEILNRVLPL